MIYLDSSAIVKLIREEPESAALHELLAGEEAPPIFTSQLAMTEVKRALHASGDIEVAVGVATADPPTVVVPGHRILALPITADMFAAAGDVLPGTLLRSLDAIHVTAARQAGDALTALVTYDRRMTEAASMLGVPTAAPEPEPAGGPD